MSAIPDQATTSPEELGKWAVRNLLPAGEQEHADEIAQRVAVIVRGERELPNRRLNLYRALVKHKLGTGDIHDAAWEALQSEELARVRQRLSMHDLRTMLGILVPAIGAALAEAANEA